LGLLVVDSKFLWIIFKLLEIFHIFFVSYRNAVSQISLRIPEDLSSVLFFFLYKKEKKNNEIFYSCNSLKTRLIDVIYFILLQTHCIAIGNKKNMKNL
jgi:hypothetical protein